MAVNFNGSYSENFDTLATSGTSNTWSNDTTIPGWSLFRQPSPGTAIETYIGNNGTSTTGSFYSYGTTGSSDRSLGGLGSGGAYFGSPATGNIAGWIAFSATNTTGSTIDNLNVAFNGEQWRNGGNTNTQPMILEYGFGSSFTTVPTWTAPGSNFDWNSPIATSTAGAVDGNTAGRVANRGGVLSGLNWANNDKLWIRWVERNDTGNDHGLAIDDFSISTSTIPTTPIVTIVATDASAAEAGADTGNFRITRTGDITSALTVNYSVAGTATNVDYTPNLTGVATIAANQSFVDITITPVDDLLAEGNETVTLTLTNTADYDLGATPTATVTIADNDFAPGNLRIHDIQGAAHVSPLSGQAVNNVSGIVTVVRNNGFYLEDPNPDANEATSEGIFVFTSSAPTVAVGDSILVSGTVSEFRPGGDSENLSTTQITSPSITTVSSGNVLPTPTVISAASGAGIRTIPNQVIVNDTLAGGDVEGSLFDPSQDGIDFYESLEGMRVQINNPVTSGIRNGFGEVWVLADNGAGATGINSRGSITVSGSDATNIDNAFANSDFNPELIQIDDTLSSTNTLANANSGTQLNTIVGVVDYSFGEFEILPTTSPTVVTPSSLTKEVTNLTSSTNQLTLATFNVENLDPGDGQVRFNALGSAIVNNLKSPDIISLEEIQDNNGAINDSVVDASTTYQTLIDAIAAAGGPTYQFRQINPVDDTNGGEPGGNIRVGFLFNPNRVEFVDRPGGTSTSSTTINNTGGAPEPSSSPGLIDPTNSAFNNSRKPLVGEFVFNGQTVFVIGNHFTSRGGSDSLFERIQPPTQGGQNAREAQAALVNGFVDSILAVDPTANVAVVGDLNEFQFFPALQILEGDLPNQQKVLNNLIETLPAEERYTYNFEGNSQALDHILASNNLTSKLDGFDVVHINSEFTDQLSDHDPIVTRFNLPPSVINGTSGRDTLVGTSNSDTIVGAQGADTLSGGARSDKFVYNSLRDRGDTITDFELGIDKIVLTQLLDSLIVGGYNGTDAIADGYLKVSQGSSSNNFKVEIDADGKTGVDIFRPFISMNTVGAGILDNPANFIV
jgi:predicted extracellular nuclease